MKIGFVAGPYNDSRGDYYVEQNIRAAEAVGVELARLGAYPFIAHKNTAHLSGGLTGTGTDERFWYEGALEVLKRADFVVLMPRWQESKGATAEREFAEREGIPVFEWLSERRQLGEFITYAQERRMDTGEFLPVY